MKANNSNNISKLIPKLKFNIFGSPIKIIDILVPKPNSFKALFLNFW